MLSQQHLLPIFAICAKLSSAHSRGKDIEIIWEQTLQHVFTFPSFTFRFVFVGWVGVGGPSHQPFFLPPLMRRTKLSSTLTFFYYYFGPNKVKAVHINHGKQAGNKSVWAGGTRPTLPSATASSFRSITEGGQLSYMHCRGREEPFSTSTSEQSATVSTDQRAEDARLFEGAPCDQRRSSRTPPPAHTHAQTVHQYGLKSLIFRPADPFSLSPHQHQPPLPSPVLGRRGPCLCWGCSSLAAPTWRPAAG